MLRNRLPGPAAQAVASAPSTTPASSTATALGGDHTAALWSDEQGRADRPVPNLGGDRHGAEQRRKQRAEVLAHVDEHAELIRATAQPVDREAEAVHGDGHHDETDHGGAHADGGAGRALLEELGPQLAVHEATSVVRAR
jgi:hypothetical protein